MDEKIDPVKMFSLKKGTRIRLKDDRIIELTSDYIQDSVSYTYKEVGKTTEETISCLRLSGCHIL